MITAKQLRRPLRFILFAGLAITLGLYLKSRQPSERLTLQKNDRSMEPAYYAGSDVEARRIDADFNLQRGRDVLYIMNEAGFVGRIRGVPGDVITVTNGFYSVNGKRVGPRPIPLGGNEAPLGRVPDGKLLILNVNPDPKYDDSRNFGLVPRDQVQAIILKELR